jgi:hypothetical protein
MAGAAFNSSVVATAAYLGVAEVQHVAEVERHVGVNQQGCHRRQHLGCKAVQVFTLIPRWTMSSQLEDKITPVVPCLLSGHTQGANTPEHRASSFAFAAESLKGVSRAFMPLSGAQEIRATPFPAEE